MEAQEAAEQLRENFRIYQAAVDGASPAELPRPAERSEPQNVREAIRRMRH
jgi:hypothetical protein